MGKRVFEDRPHADLANPEYVRWAEFLDRTAEWTEAEIAEYQLGQAREMVRHAYEKAPGYRAMYEKAGVRPEDLRTLEDVKRLPFAEKEMFRDHLEEMSTPLEGRSYITTGGSTGIPCGMYRDGASFAKELASKAHQYHRVGWREGERQIVFRGLRIETDDHMEFVPGFNELRCSSYHFGTEWMEVYRQAAWEYGPAWLRCYPSSGYVFAKYLRDSGKPFPPLKGVLCSSEHLYDFQKKMLHEVFQCRIFSHYGHYEMAVLAGFCEQRDTYHVLPQYGYAELLGPDGRTVTQPGQVGEIVATSFIMYATPFIRYRTQDLGVLRSWGCEACGRPYQVWDRIEGRLQELLVTNTGRYISTSMLNMHDDFYDRMKQFQFHQQRVGELTFRYVPKGALGAEAIEEMRAKLAMKLGDDIHLTTQEVAEIPMTARGKHRLLVQEIPLAFNDAALDVPLEM